MNLIKIKSFNYQQNQIKWCIDYYNQLTKRIKKYVE